MVKESKVDADVDFKSNEKLDKIFNNLDMSHKGLTFQDHLIIFKHSVDQSSLLDKSPSMVFTSKKFRVPQKTQLFLEIYYEPYLYDLEVSLVSDDVDRVRSHITTEVQKVKWQLYKGAKSIFVELEGGEYDLQFVQKLPPVTNTEMAKYVAKGV